MTQHNTDGGAGAGRGSFGRMPLYTNPDISVLIDRAIQEDLGLGDATTDALVPSDLPGEAVIFAKSPGVLCGVEVCLEVFRRIDPAMATEAILADGDSLERGSNIARLRGSKASILMGERLGLNFLQHLSGVATATAGLVQAGGADESADHRHAQDHPGHACPAEVRRPDGRGATTTARTSATASSSRTTTSPPCGPRA